MRLEGKVAIVTGSSRGIGKAIAEAFAREGASVVINSRKMEDAKPTSDKINSSGGKTIAIAGDVSKRQDIKIIIDETVKAFGKLDIIVNNAGIVTMEPFIDMEEENWDKVIAVDLKGTYMCSQEAARQMIKQNSIGKIINIASIAGAIGFVGTAHYSAAKAGVIELTKVMAIELAKYNINVNAIGPGIIDTDMTKDFLNDPTAKAQFLSRIPIGRIGKPEDIAPLAVYLASEESSYVTGETFYVDGGWLIE
jgi:NAD(P)-dependent dehydrogenase (short-subunit alcohol dehydrogenase family)